MKEGILADVFLREIVRIPQVHRGNEFGMNGVAIVSGYHRIAFHQESIRI
jgi:hypothetical protein